MVTSKEVINYVKKNLNSKHYLSFFVAGSIPENLGPQSDLDLFIIVKREYKNEFFDNLKKIMDEFVSKNKSVTYSFFRGPLKLEKEALISFLVYTHGGNYSKESREPFINEHVSVLNNFSKKGKLISGKPINNFLIGIDLEDVSPKTDWLKKKLKLLKEENIINYPEWKKTKEGWKLLRTEKKLSNFERDYLLEYFPKHV